MDDPFICYAFDLNLWEIVNSISNTVVSRIKTLNLTNMMHVTLFRALNDFQIQEKTAPDQYINSISTELIVNY